MLTATRSFTNSPASIPLHVTFLTLVPRIETHARIYFRFVDCPETRADKVAEAVALTWRWFVRLADRGKDVTTFPAAFASLVTKVVKSGRRLCGQEKVKDVLSPLAQQRHGFKVESLPSSTSALRQKLFSNLHGQRHLDAYEERLQDNTQTPVPDQAAFRIDFSAWLETLTARERRVIRAMAQNEHTKELSRTFEVSPARISQLRRQFQEGWMAFCEERAEDAERSTT